MFTTQNSLATLYCFSEKIEKNKETLNGLDCLIGDGDHGENLANGLSAVKECLTIQNPQSVAEVFTHTGITLIRKVGGASGALYGTAFLEMAKASALTNQPLAILEAGLLGIKKRGRSTRGEKTLIDLWEPAIELLKQNNLDKEKLLTLVENSKYLVATKGRAACLGEASIGYIDPGVMSSKYFFEALLEEGVFDD